MKLTDALAKVLKENKVKNVFGLQGGAVVHIFDSLEKNKIKVTYNHHEESAALGAVANAKISNNIGCVVVTTGPASTNAITGLLAAWQDSVPCLFISGQARSGHTSYGKKVRQVGTQEVNICDIVKPITKYCKFIKNKNFFLSELKKAIFIARSGRPGPVWLDVPLDIQWSKINFKKSKTIKIKNIEKIKYKEKTLFNQFFKKSKKPLFILGYGLRSETVLNKKIKEVFKKYQIPFVTTWNAADLFSTTHKLNLGIIGMSGQRGANKAVFSADLLICLGTHLSIPHTTTLYDEYAPKARKIIINIDKNQLENLNVKFDLKIHSDLSYFIDFILNECKVNSKFSWDSLKFFKKQNWYFPKKTEKPNSDLFIRTITKNFKKKFCLVVDGGGTALYSGFQSTQLKKNDRLICSSAISSMGTGLAETIGVEASKKFKNIICIIGDGSFLMNIQDLQTIKQKKINVIIILVNNNGYLAIRNTQKEFLSARFFGTHPKWNLTMPNFKKIVTSFGIKYLSIKKSNNLQSKINKLTKIKGPIVCEIFTDEKQEGLFRQGYIQRNDGLFSPQSLNEMYPFLNQPVANTNN